MLGLGPDKLVRVELRGVGREPMDVKPFVLAQEVFDDDAPVNGAAVPKEHHRSTQMPQKVAQESDDLYAGDVYRVETKVQPETLSGWGHGDTGDNGNTIPSIAVFEKRGISDRRPGPADVRDEEESAFVEEDEMGPKFSGFFLYAANRVSSSARWLSRPVAEPAAPASDKSSPSPASPATHGLNDSVSRNVSRSAWLCAAGSTGLSYILRTGNPLPATATSGASVAVSASADVQEQAWAGVLSSHPCDGLEPSAPPNLLKHSESRLLIDRSCRTAAGRWPAPFASGAARGFQEVSCPIA